MILTCFFIVKNENPLSNFSFNKQKMETHLSYLLKDLIIHCKEARLWKNRFKN